MEIDISYIIIIAVFFILGFLITYSKKKDKKNQESSNNIINNNANDIIEMIETRKQVQIEYLAEKINELQTRIDTMEVKLGRQSSRSFEKENITENEKSVNIASNISQLKEKSQTSQINLRNHKSTVYHILQILMNKPLTSNEIMVEIGRTREHTSRLMKKLFEGGLVERDDNNKPFTYKITEFGNQYQEKNDNG